MITPFQLDAWWREYWGQYNPMSAAQCAPLEFAGCYRPSIRMMPDVTQAIVPANGKIDYNFQLKPGSIIWALYRPQGTGGLVFQFTDVNLDHKFFQEPVLSQTLAQSLPAGVNPADFENFLFLPAPHPVVGDGLMYLEVWDTPGQRVVAGLGIAELFEC